MSIDINDFTLTVDGQPIIFSNTGLNRYRNVSFRSTTPDVGVEVVTPIEDRYVFEVKPVVCKVPTRRDLIDPITKAMRAEFAGL